MFANAVGHVWLCRIFENLDSTTKVLLVHHIQKAGAREKMWPHLSDTWEVPDLDHVHDKRMIKQDP